MIKCINHTFSVFLLLLLMTVGSFTTPVNKTASFTGAWQLQEGSKEQVLIIADNYFMVSAYDKINKQFFYTYGGSYTITGSAMQTRIEFNTTNKDQVGKTFKYVFEAAGDQLSTDISGQKEIWKRLDDGSGPLCGNWRITDRMQGDKLVPMPLASRRTLKLLSGTRFQWAAINIETGEFFGTGGGTYTFANGKYTENIAFFSRDSSRVGALLSFDDKAEADVWTHTGLSSRGDKIHEIWGRMK